MRPVKSAVLSLFVLATCSSVAVAQSAPGASGHWEGTLQVPGQELAIQVDLARTGDKWEGTISIPAQGMKSFPLSTISVEADKVGFAMKGIPGDPQFKGTLAKDGKTMSGDFMQGGGSIAFALTRTGEAKIERAAASTPLTKEMEGSWEAALDVDGTTTLRLLLKLSNQPGGTGSGTLVSVDQGGAEVPVATVVQTGTHLKVLLPAISGTYEGDLKDGQLVGTWTQGPKSLPLTFKRAK